MAGATRKDNPTHALDFLSASQPEAPAPVYVLFGNEPFLKRQALERLRQIVLGENEGEFSSTTFDGEQSEWRDVSDELSTMALFGGGRRLVIIDDADKFISLWRPKLEAYVAKPTRVSVLALVADSFPNNTKLYKALPVSAKIECATPVGAKLIQWLVDHAAKAYDAQLKRDGAEALIDAVEPHLGLLDQELAKLAAATGPGGTIAAEQVAALVGGWRSRTTWDMLDTALEGNIVGALTQLDRLLLAGEEPVGLLAQIASNLRRLAAAARSIEQAERSGRRLSVRDALAEAGVRGFVLGKAEGQMKQLGRERACALYRWLLEADLALKGASSQKKRARTVLERLLVRLSKAADPRQQASAADRSRQALAAARR